MNGDKVTEVPIIKEGKLDCSDTYVTVIEILKSYLKKKKNGKAIRRSILKLEEQRKNN